MSPRGIAFILFLCLVSHLYQYQSEHMKTILCLLAIVALALCALGTVSALVWEDIPLAIGAVIGASVLISGAVVAEAVRQSRAVTP